MNKSSIDRVNAPIAAHRPVITAADLRRLAPCGSEQQHSGGEFRTADVADGSLCIGVGGASSIPQIAAVRSGLGMAGVRSTFDTRYQALNATGRPHPKDRKATCNAPRRVAGERQQPFRCL